MERRRFFVRVRLRGLRLCLRWRGTLMINNFRDRVRNAFYGEKALPLEAGMYSYLSPVSDPINYRMHLRVEPGGEGLLILQASTVLHLNQSATEFAYHLLQRTPDAQVAEKIAKRYRVSEKTALSDFEEFKERIETLIESPDLDPVSFLDIERTTPYSEALGAPYRLDVALTYNLPKGSKAAASPKKRVKRELSTDEWKSVIDKAWNAGIPHIIFTGGEATLRKDLAELLQHAEALGMVTGLLTDGIKLGETSYLKTLLDAGLDHAMIVLQSNEKKTWDSIASFAYWKEVLADDIFIAAHLTITKNNARQANGLLDRLSGSGISAVSLSENDASLADELQAARDHADFIDLPLVWDLPVPYSDLNPVAIELDQGEGEHPEGAGKAWLYVEQDGDVLPTQGVNNVLGNMLNDKWEKIWGKAKKAS
jgi:organic radical activating enzyme